jgi:hypothetical protein
LPQHPGLAHVPQDDSPLKILFKLWASPYRCVQIHPCEGNTEPLQPLQARLAEGSEATDQQCIRLDRAADARVGTQGA